MGIVIVGYETISANLMRAMIQATSSTACYGESTVDIEESVYEIKNYRDVMNELMYKVIDDYDDLEDYILPKVKPLYSQVFSKRPINNPVAGRCY